MSRVFRRTPETEEAASYRYTDLMKDILQKIARDTREGLKKPFKPSDSDLLDMATAGGGMLKVAGTGKLLAGILKEMQHLGRWGNFTPHRQTLREALQIPEKEYSRIKDIKWDRLIGRGLGTQGEYDISEHAIKLLRSGPVKGTVYHEFTHPRQLMSDPKGVLPSGMPETKGAVALFGFESALGKASRDVGITRNTFYHMISPVEKHARRMESFESSKGLSYGSLYREALEEELNAAEDQLKKLGRGDLVRKVWEEVAAFEAGLSSPFGIGK